MNSEHSSVREQDRAATPAPRVTQLLRMPLMYDLLQGIVGADRVRAEFVRDYVQPEPGDRILDLGCGTGSVLKHLPDVDYVGVDSEGRCIEKAGRVHAGRGRFLCATLGSEELAEMPAFDIVMALFFLHHLPDSDATLVCRALRGMLRAGGRFVTIDPCLVEGRSRFESAIMELDRGRHIRKPEGYRSLVETVFPDVEAYVRRDMLRIQYSYTIMVARG